LSNDQEDMFRKEAPIRALFQAMKKAEGLAKATGLRIKRVVNIAYGPKDRPPYLQYSVEAGVHGAPMPVEIGEISIEASVDVILEGN